MTDQEQNERMMLFDYPALVLHVENAPDYPADMEKNAYYGFYLLGRYAGILLAQSEGREIPAGDDDCGDLCELALDYMKSACSSENTGIVKCAFSKSKPFTYQIVMTYREILRIQEKDASAGDYSSLVEKVNLLIRQVETSRISQNPIRSLDVHLARQWCRVLRILCFLHIPDSALPPNYSYERDLNISVKRGLSRDSLMFIEFRARFRRLRNQKKIGKLILLAEEWEMKCMNLGASGDPCEFELNVLSLMDTDPLCKIGLEWVSMLILRRPENAKFRKWEARFLRRDGQYQNAHKVCSDLLSRDAQDYEVYCMQSNLYFLEGDYKSAQQSGRYASEFGSDDPVSHMSLAYAFLYDGLYTESIPSFEKALELCPTLVDAYRGKSKALIMEDRVYEAMECLVSASRIAPADAEVLHDLADVYFMCGYLDECRKYCRKCLSIDPRFSGAYVLLGMLEIRRNNDESAGKLLRRSLEIDPENPIALNELAYIRHMNGDDDECLRLLEKAAEIAPDFADVQCSMGVVYFYQSKFETALDYFDRALALDPMHLGALLGKGHLYLAQSDAEEALVWYDKALCLDPEYPDAIHGKISAFRALGLEQEAFDWIQKASDLGIDPEDYD